MRETYNRQLHVDEIKWIKENAKRFAQEESERLGHQVTEQEAMERLITKLLKKSIMLGLRKLAKQMAQSTVFLKN